jgi:hypothetical protein
MYIIDQPIPIYNDCRMNSDKVDILLKTSSLKPRKKKKQLDKEYSDSSKYDDDFVLRFLHENGQHDFHDENYVYNQLIFPKFNK